MGPQGPKGDKGDPGTCDGGACCKKFCTLTHAVGNGSSHAVWFGSQTNLGSDYRFITNATWTEYGNNTARVYGTIQRVSSPTKMWNVEIVLTGKTTTAPAGSPKIEYGTPNTSAWYYYTGFTATFIGQGYYTGAVLKATRRGPSFQIGAGANGKNYNYGGSGWFEYQVISQPLSGPVLPNANSCNPADLIGDFNLDFACVNN